MFSQVLDMGLDYRLYMKQVPANIMFKEMRRKDARRRYKMFGTFLDDLEKGTLPDFSFIEPAYFDTEKHGASDQHPDHDVSLGEALIKEVYEAVRASSVWESTALVVTWDEHGGFFGMFRKVTYESIYSIHNGIVILQTMLLLRQPMFPILMA
jgi:phospholipase C